MTHRHITSLLFTSMIAACSGKEDDTAELAAEQSEPAGLNSADDGEPAEQEDGTSEGGASENVDDGAEGGERERNDDRNPHHL